MAPVTALAHEQLGGDRPTLGLLAMIDVAAATLIAINWRTSPRAGPTAPSADRGGDLSLTPAQVDGPVKFPHPFGPTA